MPFGTIDTMINSGHISGNSVGLFNIGSIGTLSNSGVISGSSIAIYNGGTIGTLTHTGSLSNAVDAIFNDAGSTISLLTNGGTISGRLRDFVREHRARAARPVDPRVQPYAGRYERELRR